MFCAIELCSSKKKLVIKANWIKHFSVAKTCNRGLDSQIHEKFVAFYSPDVNAEPTFIRRSNETSRSINVEFSW